MSFIGPRPESFELSKWYEKDVPFFVGMSHQVLASDDKEYFNSMRNYLVLSPLFRVTTRKSYKMREKFACRALLKT